MPATELFEDRSVVGVRQVGGVELETRGFLGEPGQLCHQVTLQRSRLFPFGTLGSAIRARRYVRRGRTDGSRARQFVPEGLLVEPGVARQRPEVELTGQEI